MHASHYVNPVPLEDRPSLRIPAGSGLVLWLEAARKLQLGADSRVTSWGDLCFGENMQEDNAWQVDSRIRPRWISKAAGGRPAVRFNGSSYLVTTPFFSGDDVTAICVFRSRPQDSPNRRDTQLVDFNGPPSLILQHTSDNQFGGALVPGRLGKNQAYSGRIEHSIPLENGPITCAYLYSSSEDRSSLFVNSELVGEAQAQFNSAVRSPKYIGRGSVADSYFVGDIYEILIFNSMLTPEQCIHISTDLMDKYGITHPEREPRVLSGMAPEED